MTQGTRRELTAIAQSAYWTETEGRVAVTAWRASGETAVRFGEQHGLSPRRLRWWGQRFGKVTKLAPTEIGGATLELVPIGVIQRDVRDEPIEIAVGEFRIAVRRGIDPVALRMVVEVLRSC